MYSIQKHKTKEFIIKELKYSNSLESGSVEILIVHINGSAKISHAKNMSQLTPNENYYDRYLEVTCWLKSLKNDNNFMDYLISSVFKIYGIQSTNHSGIQFLDLQGNYIFCLGYVDSMVPLFCIAQNGKKPFYMSLPNDENSPEMLSFLIDPLQTIQKIENKPKDISIQHLFQYFRDTIIKQDNELLLKHLLIDYLVKEFMIVDIGCVIMNVIVHLLLL